MKRIKAIGDALLILIALLCPLFVFALFCLIIEKVSGKVFIWGFVPGDVWSIKPKPKPKPNQTNERMKQ